MVSNFENLSEEHKFNDLILPRYDPFKGETDFLDDKHLSYFEQYLKAVFAMDQYVGLDVKAKLQSISYKKFLQKLTKRMRYDSYEVRAGKDNMF